MDEPKSMPSAKEIADAYDACTKLARAHYENFPVGRLVPREMQPHVHAVYAFARYADDLAEEPGTEMFTISVDPDDEDLVWLYEWFTDVDAQRAHQASGAFARMATELTDVLASPPGVLRLDPLRASFQRSLIETLA